MEGKKLESVNLDLFRWCSYLYLAAFLRVARFIVGCPQTSSSSTFAGIRSTTGIGTICPIPSRIAETYDYMKANVMREFNIRE